MKKNSSTMQLYIIFSIIVLYAPQFSQYFGLLFEQFLTLGITIMIFFFILQKKNSIPACAVLCSFTFLAIFCIDLLRSVDFVVTNDFFELIKPFSFLLYFSLGYNAHFTSTEIKKYSSWFMLNFLVISLLSVGEASVVCINDIFTILYKSPRLALKMKAVFSFISPYCLATILVLPFVYFLLMFFASRKLKYIFAVLLCGSALLLTQSKTVFLGVILTFFIMICIVLKSRWIIGRKRILFTSITFFIVIVMSLPLLLMFAKEKLAYLYEGLEIFFKAFSNFDMLEVLNAQPNTRLRFEQFLFALEHQDFFPLIGVAIGKAVLMPESFYALYLYRTGLIGIFIHTFMVLFAVRRAALLSKHYAILNNIQLSSFYFSLVIFFISLVFSYFSSAVTDQTRIAFFFYFLIGHLYSIPLNQFIVTKKSMYKNKFKE